MKHFIAPGIAATALIFAASCASTPPTAPAAATAPAAPAVKSVSAQPAPAPEASVDTETAAVRKAALALGLKPRQTKDAEVYCRKRADLGTRLETMSCFTAAQIHDLQVREQSSQDNTEKLQKASLAVVPSN